MGLWAWMAEGQVFDARAGCSGLQVLRSLRWDHLLLILSIRSRKRLSSWAELRSSVSYLNGRGTLPELDIFNLIVQSIRLSQRNPRCYPVTKILTATAFALPDPLSWSWRASLAGYSFRPDCRSDSCAPCDLLLKARGSSVTRRAHIRARWDLSPLEHVGDEASPPWKVLRSLVAW